MLSPQPDDTSHVTPVISLRTIMNVHACKDLSCHHPNIGFLPHPKPALLEAALEDVVPEIESGIGEAGPFRENAMAPSEASAYATTVLKRRLFMFAV